MKKWIIEDQFKRLNGEELNELSETELKDYQKDLNAHTSKMEEEAKALKGELKTLTEKGEGQEEAIAELKAKLNEVDPETLKNLVKSVAEQGLFMKKFKNSQDEPTQKLSVIEKAIEMASDYLKESIGKPLTDTDGFYIKTVVSAASVVNNTDSLRLPEIGQLAHRRLTLWDLFPKITVGVNQNGTVRYTDWDEATKVRAAAMIAESGSFPESTAAFEEFSLTLKKVGDTIPVTEETLHDRKRFADELNLFLMTNIELVTDLQLYSGSGAGVNASGVFTTATAFTAAASGITDASIYDLVVKVREGMTAGKRSKYNPDFMLMNIIDINRYKLKKDANNNYVMPPFVSENGSVIDGMVVIETNVVTDNEFLMGDRRYARIYVEETGIQVSTGLVNDQFIKDQMTIKARRRFNLLVRTADRGAFYKVTDIDADLVTLAS